MFIDSVLLYGLVKELRQALTGAQVRQIHQTDDRVITIELYRPGASPAELFLSAQNPPSLYTARPSKKNSQYIAAQNFCMNLRKNLEGSRLSSIEQIQMDRIVRLSFDRIETDGRIITRSLYAELIPSAPNLIFTEEGRILDVLVRSRRQHRELGNQQEYTLPEGTSRLDFMQFSEKELLDLLQFGEKGETPLSKALFARFNGLSTALLQEAGRAAGFSFDRPEQDLTQEEWAAAAHALYTLGRDIAASTGLWRYASGKKETVSLIPLPGKEGIYEPSISAWIARSMEESGSAISLSVQELKKHIHSLIKKEERKKDKIQREMEETKLLDQYKLWGNLLSIYAYQKIHGQKEITVDNPFREDGVKETIPLDPAASLIQNSQSYFKKYSRMKTRLAIGREKLDECAVKLEYLKNASYFAAEVTDRKGLTQLRSELKDTGIDKYAKQDQKGHKKARDTAAEEPELFYIEDYPVWVGRNSRQNEYLTLRKAARGDLWLHAQKIPGSHVVIETGGVPVPDEVLKKAASWAAWLSRGKNDSKVPVDYTLIRNVKKIKNAPPGLVSYTHQKTIMAVPAAPEKEQCRKAK